MWLVRLLATALQGGDVWLADAHQRGVPAGGGADAWFAAGIGRKDGGDCLHVVFGLLLSSTSYTTAPHLMRGVLVHIMEIIRFVFLHFQQLMRVLARHRRTRQPPVENSFPSLLTLSSPIALCSRRSRLPRRALTARINP